MARRESRGSRGPRREAGLSSLTLVALAAVTLAVYANSLGNGLVYDDHFLVEGNRQVREMDLPAMFTTHYWAGYGGNETGQYRPLVILSLAADHALYGVAPYGYHLTNVLLHLLNSAAAFWLALKLMGGGDGGRAGGKGGWWEGPGLGAFCAGLLFAVHPVHTEVAAGVTSGRADLLACLFLFLSLGFYLGKEPLGGHGHRGSFPSPGMGLFRSLLTFALALLCKESAVALIGLVFLADVARAGEPGLLGAASSAVRSRWRGYLAFLAVFGFYLLLRLALGIGFQAGSLSRLNNPLLGAPFVHRVWTTFGLAGRYAGLVIVPIRLSVDYSFDALPVPATPLDGYVGVGMVLVAAGLWLMARAYQRSRPALFAMGLVVITYLPVSQAGPLVNALFQERFLYVPLFGLCLLAGVAVRRNGRKTVSLSVLAAATLLFAGRTVARNRDWADDASLFESAVKAYPRSVKAQSKLGDSLAERGRLDEAAERYLDALRLASPIRADVASIYNNLGNVRHLQGRLDEALEAYAESVKLEPGLAAALSSLGTVSLKKGDAAGAAGWFERLTKVQPNDAEAHYNAGIASQAAGRQVDAISHYDAAVTLRPDYAEAYYNLGNACKESGRRTEAARAYRRFVETWRGDERLRGVARTEIARIEAGE